MPNKTGMKNDLKSEETTNSKPVANQEMKKDTASDKAPEKKNKSSKKKSSSAVDDSIEKSATTRVKASSSRDVLGSSGLANTGTIISYD